MLEDVYAHSPIHKMFDEADVYGIGYDGQRASKKPVKLAVIGCGGVAQSKHIPAIMRLKTIWEPIELVGVSVRNPQQGRKVEAAYRTRWYPDYRTMLDEARPDGALVLGPDDKHFEFAAACFERGIHVLVEKPITRDLDQAAEMCKMAGRTRPDADDRLQQALLSAPITAPKRCSPPARPRLSASSTWVTITWISWRGAPSTCSTWRAS
jgi:hypothetical protein